MFQSADARRDVSPRPIPTAPTLADSNTQVLQTFSGHKVTQGRSRPAFNRGEGAVIAGDEDGRLWTWSVLDAKMVSNPQIHKRAITTVIMNPSGKEMITCSLGEYTWDDAVASGEVAR